MARQQLERWGIRFGVRVNGAGYVWKKTVDSLSQERRPRVLAPSDAWDETPGKIEVRARGVAKSRNGLDVARRAFDAFRGLSKDITRSKPNEEIVTKGESGTQIMSAGVYQVPIQPIEEIEKKVRDFANKYGILWGDDDPRTLKDWVEEAVDFLDLIDVTEALNTGRFAEFESRVYDHGDAFGIRYFSKRISAKRMVLARPGEITESKSSSNALTTEVTDFYELAKTGTSRQKANMLLARQLNRKMNAGLSLSVSLTTEGKASVVPSHLVHMLYARLWLSVVESNSLEREMTCLECGETLRGRRGKKYCDPQCRTDYHNHRRSITRDKAGEAT